MPWSCCVCKSATKKHGIKLFRFPTIGTSLEKLSRERIEKWKAALGYGDKFSPASKRICSRHFRSGKPAKITDKSDPDWVPSLNLCGIVPAGNDGRLISDSTESEDSTGCNLTNSSSFGAAFTYDGAFVPPKSSAFKSESLAPTNVNHLLERDKTVRGAKAGSSQNATYEAAASCYRELQHLQKKLNLAEEQVDFFKRGLKFISAPNEKCFYYTGITNFWTAEPIYEYLKLHLIVPCCELSTEQMFVMTLTKLRLNTPFQTLAYDHNVSLDTVYRYFHRTLQIMDTNLSYALDVPSRAVLLEHTPKVLMEQFGENRIFLLDCFELRFETPDRPASTSPQPSNCQKIETAKFLIAVSPSGSICFISPGYGSKYSEKKIVRDSGFLDILEPGDVVLTNDDLDIGSLAQSKEASVNVLGKNSDLRENQHIEILKSKYSVMSQVISIDSLSRFVDGKNIIDLIAKVCSILYNMNPSITVEEVN